MLIALGFTAASLLALLIAPAVWRRAARLTTRRIEATMPISVTDINADKDLLRAEYAVEIRKLELALGQAKQRAARHLMERNQHMVDMGKLESEIVRLKSALAERGKATSVLEQTVRKRIPDIEDQLEHADKVITAREQELAERARAFENQTESLELARALIRRQEREIDRLREALEGGAVMRAARWGRGASEDEERAALTKENGKLNADLSRLREQLAGLKEAEMANTAELRKEMQRLAGLMLGGATAEQAKPRLARAKGAPGKDEKDAAPASGEPDVPAGTDAGEDTPSGKPKPAAKQRRGLSDRLSRLKRRKVREDA
jgi:chromosome segregation ATPase